MQHTSTVCARYRPQGACSSGRYGVVALLLVRDASHRFECVIGFHVPDAAARQLVGSMCAAHFNLQCKQYQCSQRIDYRGDQIEVISLALNNWCEDQQNQLYKALDPVNISHLALLLAGTGFAPFPSVRGARTELLACMNSS